ncbi:MAG TPA: hypothetical protein VHD32_17090 [Candidatus Didemnitutus sp.]|nr:hypothetical protein [Candidatus Didemnitutus sp.]
MNFLITAAMLLLATSLFSLVRAAKSAPEGREDESGFQFGDDQALVPVRRRAVRRMDSAAPIADPGTPHLAT